MASTPDAPETATKLTREEKLARRAEREAKRAAKAAAGEPGGKARGGGTGPKAKRAPAAAKPGRAARAGAGGGGAKGRAAGGTGGGKGSGKGREKPAKARNSELFFWPRGADRTRTPNERKILVISFQKTGTTTMMEALRSLGFCVGQATRVINAALSKGQHTPEQADEAVRALAFDIADRADAVQDSPYALLYTELDERYPGSKFIYLDREAESWVKSVVGHFGKGETGLRDWIYGAASASGHEDVYRQKYVEHRDEVRAYFADRPDDILFMDLGAGDGWLKLVEFLGKADLLPAFPHKNRRS